ncbi:cupin domain-containing protein [Denitrobaculum tricleocarpae]|uniref:Cupin domain-containing protein n=2 Tax=Denitrobaculum tricleocarpae TaxID=2591009 RepID=A0A545TGP6_9PROT|nr:cupin domain-containing protein [Denitrobaculum tricleocarpae]
MPIIKPQDAPVSQATLDGNDLELGPYKALLLSDAGGLTQFGACLETLPPGSKSSMKHWHEREDEFVYILDGALVLHEGGSRNEMTAGDAATFKAGVDSGHFLENTSDRDATYLLVGTRSQDDVVHYSDRDLVLTKTNGECFWTDRNGTPVER